VSDFSKHTTVRARKAHKCVECRGTIRPGTTYIRYFVVSDGQGGSYAHCCDCQEWINAFMALDYLIDGEYLIGEFWSEVRQYCIDELGYDPRSHKEAA